MILFVLSRRSKLELMQIMINYSRVSQSHFEADCSRLLANTQLRADLRKAGFDFAIMDPTTVPYCYYVLPYSLGIPYASLSVPLYTWAFRVPRLPSFSSFYATTDRMSFAERLTCFLFELTGWLLMDSDTSYAER